MPAWPGGRVCGCLSTSLLARSKSGRDSQKCPLKAQLLWGGPRAPSIGSTKNLERVECAMCRLKSHCVYLFNKPMSILQPRSSHSSVLVKVVPWPTASTSTGNLLKAQILQPNPRPTESKTLGVGPSNLVFMEPARWFWHIHKFENHCSVVMILDSN